MLKNNLLFTALWALCLALWAGGAHAAEPALQLDKAQYAAGEAVVVKFSGLPGNPKDLITLVPAGQSDFKFGKDKQFTEGQADGELNFEGLKPGQYEARLYFNYPAGGYTVQARQTFEVVKQAKPAPAAAEGASGGGEAPPGGPSVTPEKDLYTLHETVVIRFAGLPGNDQDWITIVRPEVPTDKFEGYWQYTRGKTEGTLEFRDIDNVGDYEVRLYFDYPKGGYTVHAVHRGLKIIDPDTKLGTDKEEYNLGEPVTVTYENLPGYKTDWISITKAGSADHNFDRSGKNWRHTEGLQQGKMIFEDKLPAGDYQVRAYYNFPKGKYEVKARHDFKVVDPNAAEAEEPLGAEEETTEETEEEEDTEEEEAKYPFAPPPGETTEEGATEE